MEDLTQKAAQLTIIHAAVKKHLDNCKSEYELEDGEIDIIVSDFVSKVQSRRQEYENQVTVLTHERDSLTAQL